VTISESGRVMKLALVICDLLTIWGLIAWMRATNRSPWLGLGYAWDPLVIFEGAHSGHIDGPGGLGVAVTGWVLGARRARAAADAARGDRVRDRGRHQAAADRPGAALLEADPDPRRGRRRDRLPAALSSVPLGWLDAAGRGAQCRRVHPFQRTVVQVARGHVH